MAAFQLTLLGFDPNTSDTDHLIKWIQAPSIDVLHTWLEQNCLAEKLQEPPMEMDPRDDKYTFADGIDVILDDAGGVRCGPGVAPHNW